MALIAAGKLDKMLTTIDRVVEYTMLFDEQKVPINQYLGTAIHLKYNGEIRCVECNKRTKTAFGNGFCYPCFTTSANSAPCIIRPELCSAHIENGNVQSHICKGHVSTHYVYLSYTGGIKVGVTRGTQVPTRWIDQGATQAMIIAETPYRQAAGAIEVDLKSYFADKTAWQKMLKQPLDEQLNFEFTNEKIKSLLANNDLKKYILEQTKTTSIMFPQLTVPIKVTSHNFNKTNEIAGTLTGIKGQYLIFDNEKVVNIRTHSGYVITLNTL